MMYENDDIIDEQTLYFIEQLRRRIEEVCHEGKSLANLQGLDAYPCIFNALSQQMAFLVVDADIPLELATAVFKSQVQDIYKQKQEVEQRGQIIPFPTRARQFSDQELLREAERRFTHTGDHEVDTSNPRR